MRRCAQCSETKPLSEFYDRPGYCRVCTRKNMRAWQLKNPEKRKAHVRVAWALKWGELVRPNHCSRCDARTYTIAHHHDYSKPLDVLWVCDRCHGKIHAQARASTNNTTPIAHNRSQSDSKPL